MPNTASQRRTQLVSDIEAWDRITDHRTGTKGDAATDAWLRDAIEGAGLSATLESFTFDRFDYTDCYVALGAERIDGVPMFDGGITGPTPMAGRIGQDILCTPCAPFDGHPATLATQELRRSSGARAIVAVSAAEQVVEGLALVNAESYRDPFDPPVVQVSSVHRQTLDEASESNASAAVLVDARRNAAQASNVGTRIEGRDHALSPVVIMTPKSAWWTCTAERMGGLCVWLALMRHFAEHPPRRSLIFTANTGHELSHLGLDHFIEEHPDLDAEFWLHLGANFASLGGGIRLQASSDEYMTAIRGHLANHGLREMTETPIEDRPAGEARNIYDLGGRYVSMLGSNRWFHHPDDRWPTTIDVEKTDAVVAAFVDFMSDRANA
jgi:hypothetical protein